MSKLLDLAKISTKGGFNLFWGVATASIISSIGVMIIASILSESEYGLFAIALTAPNLIQLIRNLGIDQSIIKYTAQFNQEKNPDKIRKYILAGGFSEVILGISKKILSEYGGKVPSTLDELLKFKGVGRKTANLVLGLSFGEPSICVDTHVLRISNRLGWVRTESPLQTEQSLMNIIPKNYWVRLNTILVAFGQNECLPISPFCSKCFVRKFCKQIGLTRSR